MAYGLLLHRLSQRFSRRFKGVAPLLLAGVLSTLVAVTGCTQTEDAVILDNVNADSVVFWPSTMNYARRLDTLYVHIRGLKRVRTCATMVQINQTFLADSTRNDYYKLRFKFEIPAGAQCPAEPLGFDTLIRISGLTTIVGKNLYLQAPDGRVTDSIQLIAEDFRTSADGRTLVNAILLKYVAGGPDTIVSNRFSFTDSSLTHPRRMLRTDSLGACEVFQSAVYEKRGDTTIVKARLIHGTPRPASVFAPCAGPHADSIEVVYNRFNFLPQLTF